MAGFNLPKLSTAVDAIEEAMPLNTSFGAEYASSGVMPSSFGQAQSTFLPSFNQMTLPQTPTLDSLGMSSGTDMKGWNKTFGTKKPGPAGGWTEGVGTALDIGKFGLSLYSALEQAKLNKFMRGYYGDQMALQTADFANNARGTNEALESREERRLSARGIGADTAESQQRIEEYMKRHRVNETV